MSDKSDFLCKEMLKDRERPKQEAQRLLKRSLINASGKITWHYLVESYRGGSAYIFKSHKTIFILGKLLVVEFRG